MKSERLIGWGNRDNIDRVGLLFLIGFGLATLILAMVVADESPIGWQLAFAVSATALISIVIWQACDPFAEAAQWVGTRFQIPGSVRGATLDAVASSMPELFSGIFFVVVAITVAEPETMKLETTRGFASAVAICAGSSIYNLVLIPAICAIAIAASRPDRPQIEFDKQVINRDGFWVIVSQLGLLVVLCLPTLHWWFALIGIGAYIIYISQLVWATGKYRRDLKGNAEDPLPESTGLFFGLFQVRLQGRSVALILITATLVAATACYFLVELTNHSARAMGVPAFFVAVILAAAASSIPDTFMSLGAARRGDDSGALGNVFGSNIFDICIGMSIPLLVCCYLNDWQPLQLAGDNRETIKGVAGLRILLFVLTGIVMFLLWRKRVITRNMGYFFCSLYLVFVAYAVIQAV